uniref:SusC/RagA family TonB-linked outer membrane protein n=1 Tax=Pedobacter schmidteae TaxID=2201271 RepID=UPI0013CE6AE2|nr:SusC/RagA family TonB-linked outer membrane protein [Pedobacter schmidteae]
MRLTIVLIITFIIQASASGFAQQITFKGKNVSLQQVFKAIKAQTGYNIVVTGTNLDKSKSVTIDLKNTPLKEALQRIFSNQPLTYEIVGKTIAISEKQEPTSSVSPQQNISGTVTNERGEPLPGVTVTVKETDRQTATDSKGNFTINANSNQVLVFTFLGYNAEEKKIDSRRVIDVILIESVDLLNQVQIIAYGSTTRRLNTGSVAKISAKEIAQQPVSNPLAALSGRMPGLVVTQSSGVSGSSFSLQVRGRNSLAQGSEPLILIDGIPFAPQNQGINVLGSAITQQSTATLSPFTTINPADVESIDVLKDADATAIYGSRGANGVILITTKKGKAGKTQITANVSQGIMKATRGMQLMNTEQYLTMRREAFTNSGTTPTNSSAPDLTIWDQKRYTDLWKELLGNTGHATNAQLSLSGGGNSVQFLISGGYNRETNVFPGEQPNDRGNGSFSLAHTSANQKLNVTLSGGFSATRNTSNASDLTYYTFLPPNIPNFFNADGSLKWSEDGIEYENPYAYLKQTYQAKSNSLNSSLNLSYQIIDGLSAKLLAGYNQLIAKDFSGLPKSSNAPSNISESRASHGTNDFTSWNIEPQLSYKRTIWKGTLDVLAGTTFHRKQNENTYLLLSGFASEALMPSIQAATTVVGKVDNTTDYKYSAIFSRINYNISDKYLINFTGRRDGSSRFGPGNRFANFGAVGTAWIISAEKWMDKLKPIISFFKIRGSYGITGNDQIGDYKYLDTWGAAASTYQGTATLYQTGLFNASYGWERNRKKEGAIDLGFWNDHILASVSYYHNRSDNQLVQYKLPFTTGFSSITRNLPAIIDNSGWEFQLSARILEKQKLSWKVNANITLPKNKLVAFPELATSTYASLYEVGQSLNLLKVYTSKGIDPNAGLFVYNDIDGNGVFTSADYNVLGSTDPKYYGGIGTNISYAGLELDVFADFRKQTGNNFLNSVYSRRNVGGTMINQPIQLLDRWISPTQMGTYEKYMTSATSMVSNFALSELAYSDQSFIRLRTISLAYNLPSRILSITKAQQCRIYFQGQNLLTSSKTKGYNPETQRLYGLAPLKVFNAGIQITY